MSNERNKYTRVVADGLVRTGAGYLERVIFSATGTVTAGVISIADAVTETTPILFSATINAATPVISVDVGCRFDTGLYVGYDGTIANVATTVIWRPE